MVNNSNDVQRSTLPIPDLAYTGTVTYDAASPDTHYPPIKRLLPPDGAPNVLIVLIDDTGFGASSASRAFGGPVNTPNFERVAAMGLKYTRFHTTALCSPTRAALLSGRNHHTVGMGGITEIATSAPGYNSLRPEQLCTAGGDTETQRIQHGAVRQMPRGTRVGVQRSRTIRPLAAPRRRLRVLLRVHRRGDQPVVPGDLREHVARRTVGHTGTGLPLHGGHDAEGRRLDTPAEGSGARQAVLHLLRTRCDARPAPRAGGVGGQVRGQVRPGLGLRARGDVRSSEGTRGRGGGCRAHRAQPRHPGLGRDERRAQAGPRTPDGGLRRVPGIRRPSRRPAARRDRRTRSPRRHPRLCDHRRQRSLRRRHDDRDHERSVHDQPHDRDGGRRLQDRPQGRPRHSAFLQPLRDRVGSRDGYALPVDEAGREPLGRHAQRHDRGLAERDRFPRRDPQPVRPRHRCRADRARSGRHPGARDRSRCHPASVRRHADELLVRRCRG